MPKQPREIYHPRRGPEHNEELRHFARRASTVPTPKEREAKDLRRAKPRGNDPRTWER